MAKLLIEHEFDGEVCAGCDRLGCEMSPLYWCSQWHNAVAYVQETDGRRTAKRSDDCHAAEAAASELIAKVERAEKAEAENAALRGLLERSDSEHAREMDRPQLHGHELQGSHGISPGCWLRLSQLREEIKSALATAQGENPREGE